MIPHTRPPTSSTRSTPSAVRPVWQGQALLVLCIFGACLVGIFSRPIGYLAAFWPANAIMLGVLLRHPRLAHRASTWLWSLLAFATADLLTGSTWFVASTLNLANVAGVWLAWRYMSKQGEQVLRFQRQKSVMVLFVGCVLGALGCAAVGAWPGSIAFGVPLWRSMALWASTEFYNFLLIVPLFLSAPQGWFWQWSRTPIRWQWHYTLPLAALISSEVLSLVIGGPGAIAFIMPAMVWCAMSYGVFPITVLNFLVCFGKTAAIAMGALSFTPEHVMEVTSYRTGLALLSLAPLAVACAYALRMQSLQRLHHAVNHDYLTGVLTRRALMEHGQKLLTRLEEEGVPVAVLMLDIDHFKSVNDRYGHAQGDTVLQSFAHLASAAVRPGDLLGRMGGEEFAVVLPRTDRKQALSVGLRLCDLLREHRFELEDGSTLQVTLSVGLHAVTAISQMDTLEQLLAKADDALYHAKNNGRDQVHQYGPSLAPSSI